MTLLPRSDLGPRRAATAASRPAAAPTDVPLEGAITPPVRSRSPRRLRRGSFRPDIQGLRAVAVVAVVLSHAGVPGFGGGYVGVDVFFVISGFLITNHLLRELATTGRIGFGAFYARRIRRLLPAAATVVLVSGLVTLLFESVLAARHLAQDALWAGLYAINIHLAVQGTDYFAAEDTPSTLQHFWSLAVEEQFYVVWPALLLAAGVWMRRRRGADTPDGGVRFSRRGLLIAIGMVVAGSFALSVWQTTVSQPWAYFGLHTRAWELGTGALVATGLPFLARVPASVGRLLSWAGLAGITTSVLMYDDNTAFPGYAALLPVAGCALVIAGGAVALDGGAQRLLGRAPFQAVGAVSYSWYLWHWPVLLLMPAILGWRSNALNSAFVAVMALLLAILAYQNVETPLRSLRLLSSTRHGLLLGLGVTLSLTGMATVAMVALPPVAGHGSPVSVAAGDMSVIRSSLHLRAAPSNLTPTVEQAPNDVPASRGDGCHLALLDSRIKEPCDYGDANGHSTMVLFGDSHADQWLPALDTVASDKGYRLFARTKAACPPVDMVVRSDGLGREYTECTSWRQAVMAEIADLHPDVVVMSASFGVSNKSSGDWGRATTSTVSALTELGATVIYIDDTPRRDARETGPDCIAAHLADVSACVTPGSKALPFETVSTAVLQAVRRSGGLTVDPENWFCADNGCPAVIGNYLIYRDQSHITATYMRFLAPELERTLGFG